MAGIKYKGMGDPFLDFDGNAVDFDNQAKFDKEFQVTVSNANTADQLVILNPSRNPSNPSRVVTDGNIAYASGATDLTASGYPDNHNAATGQLGPIKELQLFLKANPSRVLTVKVASNNSAQISKALTFTYRNVFAQPASENISLNKYTDEYAPNDKLVTVKKEFQLDDDTELACVIPAAIGSGNPTTTTFTFNFGASISLATALKKKRTMSL